MEPVILGLAPAIIVGLIGSLAVAAKAFGLAITDDQVNAIKGLVVPVMTVLGAAGVWWARRRVTPTSAPTLPSGTTVTTTDEAGKPTGSTTV